MSKSSEEVGRSQTRPPVRVVLAKLGLDGHDRGLKVVARMLRDGGMEVIYLGLRQTTETIIDAVEQEDADVVGISMLNAGHLTLGPRMVEALVAAGLDVPVVIGGIVPDEDLSALVDAGVAGVLGPGASADEVVACVLAAADSRG
jgi:methylmalonyl-CoA mutase cobalamin-binding domain/chain